MNFQNTKNQQFVNNTLHTYLSSDPLKQHPPFEHLEICATQQNNDFEKSMFEATQIANGTIFARDLGNEQADICNPEYLEEVARNLAKENPAFSVRVLKGKELEDEGLNMITAVGQGSQWEPRLILLEYKPLKDESIPTVLLGKGITFDTGGLNIKPTGYIENMHLDMCGSATVLGAAKAIGSLNIQQNIGKYLKKI